MLDKYGRLIDDSRDYTICQELELVFKRDKEFAPLDRAEEKCWQQCGTHVQPDRICWFSVTLWTTAG